MNAHKHKHTENQFAVIPTPSRLSASSAFTGKGITIALLDSGFYPHPDLTEPVNRIVGFHDVAGEITALDPYRSPAAYDWHGTMTSVVCAGNGNLSDGTYRGLASHAKVVLVKISQNGRILEENIARGFEWVIKNKDRYRIRVISVSLGGDGDVPYQTNRVDLLAEQAIREGLVVVVAAGNSGCSEEHKPVPPANAPGVITVGGYDDKNLLNNKHLDLYCSSFGPTTDGVVKPEIIAPAIWIAAPILPNTPAYRKAEALSAITAAPDFLLNSIVKNLSKVAELPEELHREMPPTIRKRIDAMLKENKIVATHYQHVEGTSFAAPVVASVVAQMLEANSSLNPVAVKQILIATATRIANAPLLRQGYGSLNAAAAVKQAASERHTKEWEAICPPRIEGKKLIFSLHHDSAERVSVAGDFNRWNPHPAGKSNSDGVWQSEIPTPPAGRYRYKFILDEKVWTDDPANPVKELDEFGGFNSILVVN